MSDPFSEQEEKRLEWYFEHHLRQPFTDHVLAQETAASIERYGHDLFGQVFADPKVQQRYGQARQGGVAELRFEIAGSPDFHRLHWEALKDPNLSRPFALDAPMVRKNLAPQGVAAIVQPSPTINLLVVTARPGGKNDVAYRTISRPLVETLRSAGVPVDVHLLRPGTYESLQKHLETVRDHRGPGHYHIIHFDTHGALCTYQQLQEQFEADRLL